jgi:hypothetical protein
MAVTSCPDAIAKAIEKVMQASKTNRFPPVHPHGAGRKGRPAPDMTPASPSWRSTARSAARSWSTRAAVSPAGTAATPSVADPVVKGSRRCRGPLH